MKSGRLTVGLANLRMLFCIILTIALGDWWKSWIGTRRLRRSGD